MSLPGPVLENKPSWSLSSVSIWKCCAEVIYFAQSETTVYALNREQLTAISLVWRAAYHPHASNFYS